MTDVVTQEVEDSIFSGGVLPGPDYTDLIGQPSTWMTAAGLKKLGQSLRLEGRELTAFTKAPEDWLQENGNQWTDHELDQAWVEFVRGTGSTSYRKSEAIVRLFTKTTIEGARERYVAAREACAAKGVTSAEFLARARSKAQQLALRVGINDEPTHLQWAEAAEVVARGCRSNPALFLAPRPNPILQETGPAGWLLAATVVIAALAFALSPALPAAPPTR